VKVALNPSGRLAIAKEMIAGSAKRFDELAAEFVAPVGWAQPIFGDSVGRAGALRARGTALRNSFLAAKTGFLSKDGLRRGWGATYMRERCRGGHCTACARGALRNSFRQAPNHFVGLAELNREWRSVP